MLGMAIFTTVASSRIMKKPTHRTSRISQGFDRRRSTFSSLPGLATAGPTYVSNPFLGLPVFGAARQAYRMLNGLYHSGLWRPKKAADRHPVDLTCRPT